MDDGNVIQFCGTTTVDIEAEKVLDGALNHGLDSVLVLGMDRDGEFYAASTTSDPQHLLWLMEKMRFILMDV